MNPPVISILPIITLLSLKSANICGKNEEKAGFSAIGKLAICSWPLLLSPSPYNIFHIFSIS